MEDQPIYRDDEFEDDELLEGGEDLDVSIDDFDDIIVAPSDWTISSLSEQIGKQIDLDPEFQRRGVWSNQAKCSFIESLFLNIPIPQILLAQDKKRRNNYIVLDGKQRLLTIKEFFDSKYENGRNFRLKGLRILEDLNGKNWNEIKNDNEFSARILNHTQRTAVLKGWKKEGTLYEVFHRLNSGSVKLSPMELRMSLYPGSFLRKIIKWTEEENPVRDLLKLRNPDKRMADVEITVRNLAFQSSKIEYKGNLKAYLDGVCILFNDNFDEYHNTINAMLDNLSQSIECGKHVFENNLCRKWKDGDFENRFNRAVFDIQIGALCNQSARTSAQINSIAHAQKFIEVSKNDNRFVSSLETTTKSIEATSYRFETWYNALNQQFGLNLKTPLIEEP